MARLPWMASTSLARGRARRGAGDQESGGPPDARGEGARRAGTDRADRHAGREPADGSVVDLRRRSTRACWARIQPFARWTKRLAAAPQPSFAPLRELVRPYILRRMKTDPAVIAGSAGQDGSRGVLHAVAAPGRALSASRSMSWRTTARRHGAASSAAASSSRFCCGSNRSSITRRTGSATTAGARRTAASSSGCARLARPSRASRRRCCLHAVPRDDRAAVVVSGVGVRPPRARAARRHAGRRSGAKLVEQFQHGRDARRFSCSRSRPAAPGSISRPRRTSSTSIAGGIRRSRTRRPIARSASARRRPCSSTSSSAAARSKRSIDDC